jgi:hypothetical protein
MSKNRTTTGKQRYINTRIWNDGYFMELNSTEKLLFFYFLTNSHTSICGIYELPLRYVAMETDTDIEKVRLILEKFTKDGKILYVDGWVYIKNFIKHQSVNASMKLGVMNGIKELVVMCPKVIEKIYSMDKEFSIQLKKFGLSLGNDNHGISVSEENAENDRKDEE